MALICKVNCYIFFKLNQVEWSGVIGGLISVFHFDQLSKIMCQITILNTIHLIKYDAYDGNLANIFGDWG